MELTHDFVVPAAPAQVWAAFMDLERVGGCFPGATVTDATTEAFAGSVKVKLGPIALVYAGSGAFVERDDTAYRAVIEAKGKDKRGNGTAGATVTLQLSPAEADATRVDVTTELAITGKPAQFGRGVMQDVSDALLQQFVACIEGQFTAASAPSTPAAPDPVEPVSDGGPAEASPGGGPADSSEASLSDGVAWKAPVRTDSAATRPADSINLGATVVPVLLKNYAPHAIGAVVVMLLGFLWGRRRRR